MKKYLKSLSGLGLLFLTLFIIISCNSDNDPEKDKENQFLWKQIGLNGIKVNKLVFLENFLYAATEDGIYKKNVNVEESFVALGLQGKNIETILVFDQEEIIASILDFKDGEQIGIYRTTNGGLNWEIMETNFGDGIEPHIVWEFLRPFEAGNTIYATSNYLLARSEDKGITWTPVWGDWGQFARATSAVAINPLLPNEIWLGGQGGIEDGYLVHLENEIEINRWLDLVPNPTTVKKIAFDSQNPQTIYVGFEGALLKTSSNGQSWETLIDEHQSSKFFFGINISELDNNKIYAAGWLKGNEPQPLVLYYSVDKGLTWKQDIFTAEQYGGVLDMLLKTEGNKERLFLALDKGGVYEVIVQE